MIPTDDFSTAILTARLDHGLKQLKVALSAGIDPGHLCRVEQGKRQATQAIAAALTRAYRSKEVGLAYCNECPVEQAIRELEAKERRNNVIKLPKAA